MMDASVPKGAAILLDFIAGFESRGDYNIIFGGHQTAKPITEMTLSELLAAQKAWGAKWGSSASGRYQIMRATLTGLMQTLGLSGKVVFSADLQDRLGYQLLKQRGYSRFKSGSLDAIGFGRALAQEWASLPILAPTQGAHRKVARGETYYAGDKLNRALVTPEKVEAILTKVAAASS